MIELNGIYKLKKIKGFKNHDTSNYKVVAISGNNVLCEKESGERYCFLKNFLIDPEYPDIIYSDIEILELS